MFLIAEAASKGGYKKTTLQTFTTIQHIYWFAILEAKARVANLRRQIEQYGSNSSNGYAEHYASTLNEVRGQTLQQIIQSHFRYGTDVLETIDNRLPPNRYNTEGRRRGRRSSQSTRAYRELTVSELLNAMTAANLDVSMRVGDLENLSPPTGLFEHP